MKNQFPFKAKVSILLAAACFAFSVPAKANTEELRLKFGSVPFGPNKALNVNSGKWLINPSEIYQYEIKGSIRGKQGDLRNIISGEISLAALMESTKSGSSKLLKGSFNNPGGALPATILKRKISGKATIPQGALTFVSRLEFAIDANGQAFIKASKPVVKLNGKKLKGTIAFQKGSELKVTTAPVVQMKTELRNVVENEGSILIEVRRIGYQKVATSVAYSTVDVTAIAGQHYTSVSGTVNFPKGSTTQFIEIPILDDELNNGFREFDVILSEPGSGAVLGDKPVTRVGIKNDDGNNNG
jgi:hypothetical protein